MDLPQGNEWRRRRRRRGDSFCGKDEQHEHTSPEHMEKNAQSSAFAYHVTQPSYSPTCPASVAFVDFKPSVPPTRPELASALAAFLKTRDVERQLACLSLSE